MERACSFDSSSSCWRRTTRSSGDPSAWLSCDSSSRTRATNFSSLSRPSLFWTLNLPAAVSSSAFSFCTAISFSISRERILSFRAASASSTLERRPLSFWFSSRRAAASALSSTKDSKASLSSRRGDRVSPSAADTSPLAFFFWALHTSLQRLPRAALATSTTAGTAAPWRAASAPRDVVGAGRAATPANATRDAPRCGMVVQRNLAGGATGVSSRANDRRQPQWRCH
mmetsp:Transcript_11819/g.43196  ORF Transcript_11819/g.43196 Transcript_11819/m.43196 type:complete len:228 (-) Transcript_11819:139-822(-)